MLSAYRYFQQFSERLSSVYGRDEAMAITRYVTSETLLIKHHQLSIIDKNLPDEDIAWFDRVLERLLDHEPVQYILGYAWFCGLKFTVDANVLIPRPETEELVELVVKHCRDHQVSNPSIIDLGTGSGCIAVALKKQLPAASLWAADLAEGALKVAELNARNNRTEIGFILDDMLNPSKIREAGPFDIIVSNPPYIDESEEAAMSPSVTRFEPRTALFSPGDPLRFYRAINNIASGSLKPGGTVWVELNPLYAEETRGIFHSSHSRLINDMSGKSRFLKAGLS